MYRCCYCCVDAKTLDLIESMCKSAGYLLLRLDGQTPTVRRMELVERFNCQSSPECKLCVLGCIIEVCLKKEFTSCIMITFVIID